MTEKDESRAIGRDPFIQQLERVGTGLLGIGIIATLISVPTLLVILLLYLLIAG